MQKHHKIIYHTLFLILLTNFLVGYHLFGIESKKDGTEQAYEKMRVFTRVLKLIRKDYVDDGKASYEDLMYSALKGMVSSLDRFSSFMTPDEFSNMQEDTKGEFAGLGIYLTVKKHYLTVITPLEDTPAFRAGIIPGDKIVKIEKKPTDDMSVKDAVKLLKGLPGTDVNITIFRPATKKTLDLTLTRAIIKVSTIKDVKMIEPGIGYIRITQFGNKTSNALGKALEKIKKAKAKALILDLRNNPGGLLTSAVEVASYFIPKGKLIVYTEGRDKALKQKFLALKSEKYFDHHIVILVNQNSASAAEIVSGCLKDYGRAILLGEKTFGKGSVQTVIPLQDNSALRLTTAKYYTPSKKVIHGVGIEPDIEVKITQKTAMKLAMQKAKPKILGKVPAYLKEDGDDVEDEQLNKAIEVIKAINSVELGKDTNYKKVLKKFQTTSIKKTPLEIKKQ